VAASLLATAAESSDSAVVFDDDGDFLAEDGRVDPWPELRP
jgi:hypothetical protein